MTLAELIGPVLWKIVVEVDET
uniref:Uncharacterized protein n=1 Tax=Anguilla anguilla TaxID=7936 RepID=A0A0E9RE54_ANGAN